MRQNGDFAISAVMNWEAGFDPNGGDHLDPNDPGGRTRWGLTQRDHPDLDFDNLRKETAALIFEDHYWRPAQCDLWPGGLDAAIFDSAVLDGPQTAIVLLQRALGLHERYQTGFAGTITKKAVALERTAVLCDRFMAERALRYAKLRQADRYARGWTRRLFYMHRAVIFPLL